MFTNIVILINIIMTHDLWWPVELLLVFVPFDGVEILSCSIVIIITIIMDWISNDDDDDFSHTQNLHFFASLIDFFLEISFGEILKRKRKKEDF